MAQYFLKNATISVQIYILSFSTVVKKFPRSTKNQYKRKNVFLRVSQTEKLVTELPNYCIESKGNMLNEIGRMIFVFIFL